MDLFGKTITELQALIKEKKVAASEVWEYFVKRSKRHNPKLNAYVSLLEKPSNPIVKGIIPKMELWGIPLAVKDNYCTKGVRTTASSKVLDDFISPYESTVTSKLKLSGYELLGKTNMDAWAHGASTETSDYGLTKNPWDLGRYPGGSSGGSAAAVAAYIAPGAIGSDTGGSIRHPSAWCGIIGLKPTYGRVSRYGVIAMGSSFDCPGPMTQSVEDNAMLLQIMAGKDPYDATSSPVAVPDYRSKMKTKRKLKIGIAREYLKGVEPDIQTAFENMVDVIKKMGHSVVDVSLMSPEYSISVYTIAQRAEVSSNLGRYDGIRYANNRAYFGQEAKRRIMLGTYTLSHGYYDAFYKKAQKVRTLIKNNFKKTFEDVDLIIGPNTPVTALKVGEFEKYPFFGELMDQLNESASVAGIPAMSIPIELDSKNLPIGMQIMGNYFDESSIFNFAYQIEQETNFFDVIKKGREKYK
ncbi:Asp-tRNA(Asn)/Glu-tRNA(Gln) amidotransferase GatCAB subunit A [Candidatus Roizmanbacteria bacterium CG10_big_fil_rev_8_21_14_0_10_39_12]|uniref:Glutamyl-tRNA(Gln) amidotransferase subunit A n=1 Tax=Candidatus Roizmanbacteria bacterium CG10_big_fil_rev_8_21_14_0_10_39_12 TaxID=1974852 RepID=A0A2M8KQ76_9BACT|nr:MAG: Asp-tRNA(Asn)/Glu-tRNA(Gln) amidotransferase GatCAB subunit A [Candidatus Roizmanbacteria bacterium CG10_big_fil_rev_8_21_14_0_10_39_12]